MNQDQSVLPELVEKHDGITVLRAEANAEHERGWNGIRYQQGLSGRNCGAQNLSINVASVPPGAIAYAHIHVGFEVMLYIVQGTVRHDFGPNLEHSVVNSAGDFIYIEPGIPHEVFNIGAGTLVAFVARSTADEWDKIVNVPSKYRPQTE
jgi:uncharacterized RmlC-like cupin family protein